jgi:hypothetical protein
MHHRLADYGAYYRAVKRREGGFSATDPPRRPDPVEHCGITAGGRLHR